MLLPLPADMVPLDLQTNRWKLTWLAFLQSLANFPAAATVAGLPVSAKTGTIYYASNGRKPGESAGHGTGVLVYFDSTGAWISVHSGIAITA